MGRPSTPPHADTTTVPNIPTYQRLYFPSALWLLPAFLLPCQVPPARCTNAARGADGACAGEGTFQEGTAPSIRGCSTAEKALMASVPPRFLVQGLRRGVVPASAAAHGRWDHPICNRRGELLGKSARRGEVGGYFKAKQSPLTLVPASSFPAVTWEDCARCG